MSFEWSPEMTEPDVDDVPMFEVPSPPLTKVTRKTDSKAKPQWSRYRVKNLVKCDDCMFLLATSQGRAPAARFALFRRKQGADDLLLCEIHAQYRRDEDGLKPFERKSL